MSNPPKTRLDLSLLQQIGANNVMLRSTFSPDHRPNVTISFAADGPNCYMTWAQFDELLDFMEQSRRTLSQFVEN